MGEPDPPRTNPTRRELLRFDSLAAAGSLTLRFQPAVLLWFLTGLASAEWEIMEKSGQLRVANGRIGVVLTQEAGNPASISLLAADPLGGWQQVCRTLRPDFEKAPDANKLFDTSVTPHRYQSSEVFTEFSITSRNEKQVRIKMSGHRKDRIVAEQVLTLDHDGKSLHVEVSASLHEPLLDYMLSTWEFVPKGAPDFVHSPTTKKDDRRSGPAVDQVTSHRRPCLPFARHRAPERRLVAGYLMKEILPQQRWIDLEVYYSCGRNPLGYAVDETFRSAATLAPTGLPRDFRRSTK